MGSIILENEKGVFEIEGVYHITYKFQTKDNLKEDEFKKVFHLKLFNIILKLENENLVRNKS